MAEMEKYKDISIEGELKVVEPIMNYQKVNYQKMRELIDDSFIKGNEINMYINMNSILEYFYTPSNIDAMNSLSKFENILIVPEFINIMAHYRHYFFSRFGVKTRFFVYYLNKPVKYRDENYCKKLLEKQDTTLVRTGLMNDIIKTNISMINTICRYLKDIYFIESNGIDHSLIPYFIMKRLNKKEKQRHIVMTHDYFDYQLLNIKNSIILSAAGSKSRIYTKEQIYDKKLSKLKYVMMNDMSPKLFSLILSLSGDKGRDIVKLNYGFGKAIKKIDQLLDSGLILNDYNYDMENLSELFDVDKDSLYDNMKICDLRLNYRTMDERYKELIKSKLINLQANNIIMYYNQKYFKYNNIQLIELEEGV